MFAFRIENFTEPPPDCAIMRTLPDRLPPVCKTCGIDSMSETEQKPGSEVDVKIPCQTLIGARGDSPIRLPIGSMPSPTAMEFGLHGTPNAPLSGVLAARRSRPITD